MLRASSSAPVRRHSDEGVARLELPSARPLWLLGADICVFTRLDLANVPDQHRSRAIAQRARQLAPFAEPGWHAADHDGRVALWCWDAAGVQRVITEQEESETAWQILPEQLFFTAAEGDCLRELPQAQILERWQDGRLIFSARLPDGQSDQGLWLRAAGLPVDAALQSLPAGWCAERWDKRALDWRKLAREPVAASIGLLVVATLWLCWSLGELAGAEFANRRMESTIQQQQDELGPLLDKREEALALASRGSTLGELLTDVSAIEAAAEFEHLVGKRYKRLLEWQYSGRQIRVTVEDSSPDNRAYVEALERSPWFEKVSVSPAVRSDQLNLEITLADNSAATPAYRLKPGGAT